MSDPNGDSLIDQQRYRALRVDHTYPGKPHSTRSWMWWLSFVFPVIGAAALGALLFAKKANELYEPGPVSSRHIWFNQRCEDCHEKENGKFGLVSNQKCRKCHDGPLHNERQVCPAGEKITRTVLFKATSARGETSEGVATYEEPRCASCHTEHKGVQQLVQMSDNHCTQCHLDLKVKEGPPVFMSGIRSFMNGHPEWRALRMEPGDPPNGNDRTPLKFNHMKHMEVRYEEDSKYGARKMICSDCHRASQSNLELMPASSTRMDDFVENVLKRSELEAFYDEVISGAQTSGLLKYQLTRLDTRKLAIEALSRREVYAALQKVKGDRAQFKAVLERSLLTEIRERFGNAEVSSQKRYMLPISYERHCATECHTHELLTVNGVIPPHGKAEKARQYLRNILFADTVKQSLGAPPRSDADKAKAPLVKKLRDALEKDALAAKTAIPSGSSAKSKVLADTMKTIEQLPEYLLKTLDGKTDDVLKMLDGVTDLEDYKKYAATPPKKRKDQATEELQAALEKLITAFADDGPLNAASLDSAADDKLAEATKKLFAPTSSEKGACLYCHFQNDKNPMEVVLEPNIPERWLNHSIFNHETHRVIDCESCHNGARTSRDTAQVLLPSIRSCQDCHNPKGARIDCIECHIYHDKTHQRQDTVVPIDSLIKRGAETVAPVSPDVSPGK
jgi:hypothetical protein